MKIAIIGNGISGITAARYLRKLSNATISVISSETDYFFSRTALMYVYMGHMRWKDIEPYEKWFWKKNRIDLYNEHIQAIDCTNQVVTARSGKKFEYDHLILGLGSKSNKFGWPGQDLKGVTGLYLKQDLEAMEAYSADLNRAVVVGGGLIGIEMAEMFHSRNIPVSLIVREKEYWDNVLPQEEASMVSRHIRHHNIDLRLGSNLQEILDDGTGKAGGIVVKETGEAIDCGFVGLTPGVSPNISLADGTDIETDRGILVDANLQTSVENVWAIGDCAQLRNPNAGRSAIEAVWYTGRMMGETVAYNVVGEKRSYDPGIWFNSAKFFDIEYQVYGSVPPVPGDDLDAFFWSDNATNRSLRIVFKKTSGTVVGFNLMGIRFRQEVCNKWIADESHIDAVIKRLSLAHFDPEFYNASYRDILQAYNDQHQKNLRLAGDSSLDNVMKFIKS